MDNKLRLERLTELQGMLTHHDQLFKNLYFDMGTWFDPKDGHEDQQKNVTASCGTAACALGSAALHKPFMKQGLRISGDVPVFKGEYGEAAGAKFFGITDMESASLFDPSEYEDWFNVSTTEVADKVAALIEKYKGENNES